jgi:4a-hydroxytetrahydrobiopterin dehydratase
MGEPLVEKVCTPCRGGVPPLTREEAERYLGLVRDWELLDDARRIRRTYRFGNFRRALAFVRDVGELAEAEGHHPDVCFGWRYAAVSLRTEKIGRLHENDFIVAAEVDRLAGGAGAGGDRGPSPPA